MSAGTEGTTVTSALQVHSVSLAFDFITHPDNEDGVILAKTPPRTPAKPLRALVDRFHRIDTCSLQWPSDSPLLGSHVGLELARSGLP